ncbi:DUF6455 family protein [Jannaschia sp. CCS1]|uniref:DUF6455 family protein n=1 Tax=Jannaschia sp. (strain CCS1) TaxID=290400 RepID=UPI000053DE4A|nr:DUF6455 family protein [Jannaschia sp. CCS1]ABD54371.1 hypothetical protein Jann_1454 [Jannaschia sp. CCS1]
MLADRLERSVTLAKEVADRLDVDLFDDHRRGRFRDIVQNCLTCAYQQECQKQVMDSPRISSPLPHCRNKELFERGA